jgi:hypothetical protein
LAKLTTLTIEILTEAGPKLKTFGFVKDTVLAHTKAELSVFSDIKIISEETSLLPILEHAQDALQSIENLRHIFSSEVKENAA